MIKADRAAFDGDVVDRYHLAGQVPPEARSMVIAPCERLARNSAGGLKSSLRLSRCSGRIVRVFGLDWVNLLGDSRAGRTRASASAATSGDHAVSSSAGFRVTAPQR